MKCNDLLYYIMRHFSVDFNMDEKEIPRQWVDMKPEEITILYVRFYLVRKKIRGSTEACWLTSEVLN